eukprot:916021-Rhodomonas_salina.1
MPLPGDFGTDVGYVTTRSFRLRERSLQYGELSMSIAPPLSSFYSAKSNSDNRLFSALCTRNAASLSLISGCNASPELLHPREARGSHPILGLSLHHTRSVTVLNSGCRTPHTKLTPTRVLDPGVWSRAALAQRSRSSTAMSTTSSSPSSRCEAVYRCSLRGSCLYWSGYRSELALVLSTASVVCRSSRRVSNRQEAGLGGGGGRGHLVWGVRNI